MTDACAQCAYFKRDDHTDMKGRCRRWPMTIEKMASEWCGEYEAISIDARKQYDIGPPPPMNVGDQSTPPTDNPLSIMRFV